MDNSAPIVNQFDDTTHLSPIRGGLTIVAGRARMTAPIATGGGLSVDLTGTVWADQYSEGVVATLDPTETGAAGLVVRQGESNPNNYYLTFLSPNASNAGTWISASGSLTQLSTYAVTIGALPGVLRFEAQGSRLSTWWKGQLVDRITDTTYKTGTPGVNPYPLGNVVNVEFDRWEGGPLTPNMDVYRNTVRNRRRSL